MENHKDEVAKAEAKQSVDDWSVRKVVWQIKMIRSTGQYKRQASAEPIPSSKRGLSNKGCSSKRYTAQINYEESGSCSSESDHENFL